MQCWGSAEWRSGWHEYAHDFCYIENTYFIPMADGKITRNIDLRKETQLGYYQVEIIIVKKINYFF